MSSRRFIENCPALSLATLQRQGDFVPGGEGRLSLLLTGDGQLWRVDVGFTLSEASGLLVVSDGTGWKQWLKLCRRTDTRGRQRWLFEDKDETYQKAYFIDGRFASRQAHGLTYHSESLSRSQRHWAKLADEEMSLRAAADRNEISEVGQERLLEIEKHYDEAMAAMAGQLDQPRLNKKARRERFEQEIEDAQRRLSHCKDYAAPLDTQTVAAITAKLKADTPPLRSLADWRARSDHGFADRDRPHLNIAVLTRLGLLVEGERTVTHVGWGADWNSKPERQIYLISDLTSQTEPFAVLIQQEAGGAMAQLFWTPKVIGDFNKPSRRFVDPYKGHVSKILLFDDGLFTVREPS